MQIFGFPSTEQPDFSAVPNNTENINLDLEIFVHFSMDKKGVFTYVSENIEQFAHYKTADIIGRSFKNFIFPEDLSWVDENITRILGGAVCNFECRAIRKDTSINIIKASVRPLWVDGSIIGMAGILTNITEKNKIEEALKESRLQLTEIIDFLPDATFAINREGQVIIWNHAMEDISGCSADDMLGKKDYEYAIPFYGERRPILIDLVFSPDDEVQKKYRQVKRLGNSLVAEVDAKIAGGEIHTVWVKVIPLYDSRGNVVGAMEAIRDINDFKLAEREQKNHIHYLECMGKIDEGIKKSANVDELLANMVNIVLSVFACDRAWFIQPCDPNVENFCITVEVTTPEFPDANMQGVDIRTNEKERELIRKILVSNEPVANKGDVSLMSPALAFNKVQSVISFPILPKMGKPWLFGMHQCSYPRVWNDEEKKLFKEICRRVNEGISSILVLQELQENEERFRATFEQAAVGIALVSFDGAWLRVNQKLCQIFGYAKAELLQKKFSDITYPEDVNLDLDLTRQILQGIISTFSIEKRYYHLSGSLVWANLTVSMVKEGNDKPAYFIYIIEDITRRKQAESELYLSRAELSQLNKDLNVENTERRKAEEENRQLNVTLEQRVKDRTLQLEITNRELESFSYSVSHDLRAPLRSIDGFSQALVEEYGDVLSPMAQGYLKKIRTSTKHMSKLIDDMLRLAKVTRAEMLIKQVDISQMAYQIIEDLHSTQPERRIKVVIPEKMMVQADKDLIEIVLDNLLRNAWKFTRKCPTAVIEMGKKKSKGKETFFIRDNGAGFDMTYHNKLFKSFERLHGAQEYEGTGIGLAIVKRIIQRHGGEVWAEGEVDKGATFYFTLP